MDGHLDEPRRHFAPALALALILLGCGTTNGDAIDALRLDYASERARLASYASMLPASESITAPTIPAFSPPLVWAEIGTPGTSPNAAFVAAAQLANPDAPTEPRGPDVTLDSQLQTCLLWTGPHNPMAQSALGTRNGASITNDCRAALAVPYLVVLRPQRFVAPLASSADTYAPGLLVTDVIVLSHATGAVVATARIEARSAEAVSYVYEQGSDPVEALSRFAYSTLWSSTRGAVVAAFAAGGHHVTVR